MRLQINVILLENVTGSLEVFIILVGENTTSRQTAIIILLESSSLILLPTIFVYKQSKRCNKTQIERTFAALVLVGNSLDPKQNSSWITEVKTRTGLLAAD